MTRRSRRISLPLAGLFAAALSLSCSDFLPARAPLARVAFVPRFAAQDAAIFSALKNFNLGVTTLKVALRRPNSDAVLAEKSVEVAEDASEVSVAIDVQISGAEEALVASLQMYSGTVLIFAGSINVIARAGVDLVTAAPTLQLVWVGPGATATSVRIQPRDQSLSAINGRIAFTAIALDAAGLPVTDPDYVSRFQWKVNDATLGTLPRAGGEFVALGKAGTAIISVLTPNLLVDTVRISLQTVQPLAAVSFARKLEVLDRGTTTAPIPVTTTDANNSPVAGATLTYTTRNPQIATVGANGAITGVSRGQTVIVVRAQESGSSNFFQDSLLAVVAEPGAPVLISSIDKFTLARSADVTVSIFMDMRSQTQRLGSTTVDVAWNPAQLQFQSSSNGASGVTPTVNSTLASTGSLRLAMADVNGFTGRVELLRIVFRTSATATTGTLGLSATEISAANFDNLLGLTTQVQHSLVIP